eukprot:TRINITY_DN75558_c0_g1_i1.p1 TRINITY_DN75558_c0_g1~~TRINITY_DN75558_c0_g1_i1.p1  ORF type:complete len:157 (-),score=24.79 TRINITY_DN75558_c0_g1_i1:34-504(-)
MAPVTVCRKSIDSLKGSASSLRLRRSSRARPRSSQLRVSFGAVAYVEVACCSTPTSPCSPFSAKAAAEAGLCRIAVAADVACDELSGAGAKSPGSDRPCRGNADEEKEDLETLLQVNAKFELSRARRVSLHPRWERPVDLVLTGSSLWQRRRDHGR